MNAIVNSIPVDTGDPISDIADRVAAAGQKNRRYEFSKAPNTPELAFRAFDLEGVHSYSFFVEHDGMRITDILIRFDIPQMEIGEKRSISYLRDALRDKTGFIDRCMGRSDSRSDKNQSTSQTGDEAG